MFYERELHFLTDVLEKCRIPVNITSPDTSAHSLLDPGLQSILHLQVKPEATLKDYLGDPEPRTKYRLTSRFHLCYTYFLLPTTTERKVLFVGPYLAAPLTSRELLELGERLGIRPDRQKYFEEFYTAIPVLPEGERLFTMLDSFCEYIWNSASFAIADVTEESLLSPLPDHEPVRNETYDDILAQAKTLETRYAFENELIRAVMLGQRHKESLLSSAFGEQVFEKRVADPVRNSKNYCIIMNTLLRKAAEQGGVHPVHIDALSSEYAMRIESAVSPREISELMKVMFGGYCDLVYRHSIKKHSPIVQKALLLIDADLSQELSLCALAKHLGLSSGHLATTFKKETGKTLSEYVRQKRIRHAMYLLHTTNLQVQTVAQHCGILDVQYFSKLFKNQVGKTPKEYRAAFHKNL